MDCRQYCDCANDVDCDSVTGVCQCPLGLHGTRCELSGCQAGFWGPQCDRLCPNHCATNQCDREKGHCTCSPGMYGSHCHLSCPENTWGELCSLKCPAECSESRRHTKGCDPQVC